MDCVPFIAKFPKIGNITIRETHITMPGLPLPMGRYGYVAFYCTDKTCDCRRAQIHVFKDLDFTKTVAVISYGWQSVEYYMKDFGMDKEMAIDFKGPELTWEQHQSPLARHVLDQFIINLSDPAYVKRLETEYMMMKRMQKMKFPKDLVLDIQMDCPCRSGQAFAVCCGKM
jgi:hypothetical protein